jgi:hypothetical protein
LLFQINDTSHVQAQLLQQQQHSPIMGIKITSPSADQVPVGQLTISGISTDNATSDYTVYADWNNTKPFQKVVATGPGGVYDFSIPISISILTLFYYQVIHLI